MPTRDLSSVMSVRGRRLLQAALCLVAAASALLLGGTYAARLADHQGVLLVPVDDAIRTAAPRPRRTVLVVFDGLGRDDARTMPVMQALAREWPCLDMDVGAITFSRPSYAEISTGLESDRTGCRTNAETAPLAAESIWDVARQAGREVRVSSDLRWWRELFPSGIPDYETTPAHVSYFTADRLAASEGGFSLLHPMYIDDAGHRSGVQSPEFQAALARGDRELTGLLPLLDLRRDLLIVTGDHGHALRGGHGGREDRIAHVTTCFAGAGVLRGSRPDDAGAVSSTTIAPAIALLSGLRFPRHLRASSDGADDLDVVLSLADRYAFPPDYLADRRAAISRFRGANPAWPALYRGERQRQTAAMLLAVLVAIVVVAIGQRGRPRGEIITSLCFSSALYGLGVLAIVLVHHGFDLTAIRGTTADFVEQTLATCVVVTLLVVAAHAWLRRDRAALATDLAVVSAFGLVLTLAEPSVFGWRMGFPLPSAHLLFFPIVQGMMLLVHALTGLAVSLIDLARLRRGLKPAARAIPAPSS